MKWLLPTLLALVLVVGCKPQTSTPSESAATNQTTYSVRGVVQSIATDRRKASIKHEKIPGYMAAMTMDLSVKNTNEFNGISSGDEITFSLVVTEDDDWIENLKRTGKTEAVALPTDWHRVEPELGIGDTLPDYEFTGEDARTVKFSDFHGRAVAFTFFFTSCPLPEYCPRMNKNFAEARKILTADTNAPANWQFLSISFDSSFDTPQILSGYGNFYRGDSADRWLFAVASTNTLASLAPKVDLNFWRENGSITHNLRTVVLDGSGKIFKQFDGNDWTAQQLADAIRDAAKASKP
jgi:protein SCO1/2